MANIFTRRGDLRHDHHTISPLEIFLGKSPAISAFSLLSQLGETDPAHAVLLPVHEAVSRLMNAAPNRHDIASVFGLDFWFTDMSGMPGILGHHTIAMARGAERLGDAVEAATIWALRLGATSIEHRPAPSDWAALPSRERGLCEYEGTCEYAAVSAEISSSNLGEILEVLNLAAQTGRHLIVPLDFDKITRRDLAFIARDLRLHVDSLVFGKKDGPVFKAASEIRARIRGRGHAGINLEQIRAASSYRLPA